MNLPRRARGTDDTRTSSTSARLSASRTYAPLTAATISSRAALERTTDVVQTIEVEEGDSTSITSPPVTTNASTTRMMMIESRARTSDGTGKTPSTSSGASAGTERYPPLENQNGVS